MMDNQIMNWQKLPKRSPFDKKIGENGILFLIKEENYVEFAVYYDCRINCECRPRCKYCSDFGWYFSKPTTKAESPLKYREIRKNFTHFLIPNTEL
jgi:hypothetical protein